MCEDRRLPVRSRRSARAGLALVDVISSTRRATFVQNVHPAFTESLLAASRLSPNMTSGKRLSG